MIVIPLAPYLQADPLIARLARHQSEDDAYAIAERAAILEHDGGLNREKAEAAAVMAEHRRRVEGLLS